MIVARLSEPQVLTDLFESVQRSGRWQLTIAVACYALVVYLTNRLLITAPARYQLLEQIAEEKAELTLVGTKTTRNDGGDVRRSAGDESRRPAPETIAAIESLLDDARRGVCRPQRRGSSRKSGPFMSLGKVLASRRYLRAAERLRAFYIEPERKALMSDARILLIRLKGTQSEQARGLVSGIEAAVKEIEHGPDAESAERDRSLADLPLLLAEARRVSYDAEDVRLERAAEGQRRVLWLTNVGLLLILAFGSSGRHNVMLFGALGGLLAPLIKVWQENPERATARSRNVTRADGEAEYVASWGALTLGPVAGALAAYGGLLLIRFLSDEQLNVLGEVFRDNSWEEPIGSFGLGLALLFGFSGGLFGRVALTASSQLLPPTSLGAAQEQSKAAKPTTDPSQGPTADPGLVSSGANGHSPGPLPLGALSPSAGDRRPPPGAVARPSARRPRSNGSVPTNPGPG